MNIKGDEQKTSSVEFLLKEYDRINESGWMRIDNLSNASTFFLP